MIRAAELVEIDRIAAIEAQVSLLRAEAYRRAGIVTPPRHERIASVVAVAATVFRTSTQMIVGRLRTSKVTKARNAAIWVSVQAFGVSSPMLGREIGGRDHSTILNSLKRAEQLRREDDRYRRITDLMLEQFTPQSAISEESKSAPSSH